MFADIIVDLSVEALDRTFQYIIPKQWEGEVFAGCCVKIPFGRGNRLIRGYVMNITDQGVIEHDLVVKRHGAVHQADQLLGHVSSPISFQLTACQLPRSHSRRCPQQRDSWRSRRGFTDSEIHYIRLPIKCQWILSKISVKSPPPENRESPAGARKTGCAPE